VAIGMNMKQLNKTGKIKTIILGILFLPNLIFPSSSGPEFGIGTLIMPLIFGTLAIPFLTKINSAIFGQIIEQPDWNDNPLNFKRPLRFFQFMAVFFLVTGASTIIGTAIKFQSLYDFGLISIFLGIGIFFGIRFSVKWTGKKEKITAANKT
jgi:hypothetical protein